MRRPWLYLGASGWLFLSLIIHWLGVSAYRGLEFDRIYESLFIFSPSILGAAAAFVITPVVSVEGEIDLDKHYFSIAPWTFRLAAAFLAMAGLSDLLVPGEEPIPLSQFLIVATIPLSHRQLHRWRERVGIEPTNLGFSQASWF